MPEHTYQPTTGVPSGAAETAAAIAFNKDIEQEVSHIPGAYPKDEPSTSKLASTRAASTATAGASGPASGASTSVGSGLTSTRDDFAAPPSTLTTKDSPADRDAEYGEAEKTKIPGQAATAPATVGTATTSPDDGSSQTEEPSTFGKILGAVGLGSVAAGVSAALSGSGEEEKPKTLTDHPEQPTTTTGVDSYTAPTKSGPSPPFHRKESIPTTAYPQGESSPAPISPPVGGTKKPTTTTGVDTYTTSTRSGPSPSHYRKESIPTTAYPHGETSPTPINPPVGGTAVAADASEVPDSHIGRNVGLAAAGVGAAAVGAHEYNESRSQPEDGLGRSSGSATIHSLITSEGPSAPSQQTSGMRENFDFPSSTAAASSQPAPLYARQSGSIEPEHESREYSRAGTAAGTGIGAGAAAFGAHEYSESKTQPEDTLGYTGVSNTSGYSTTSNAPFASSQQAPGYRQGLEERPRETTSYVEPSTMQTQPFTTAEAEAEPRGYGKAATAADIGAGAGAAGVYALERNNEPDTGDLSRGKPFSTTPATRQAEPYPASEEAVPSAYYQPAVSTKDRTMTEHSALPTTRQEPAASAKDINASKPAPAAIPASEKETKTAHPEKNESNTDRNAAVAGAAGVGAGAYGIHEYNEHEAEQEAARAEAQRQKDIAEQEAARQRQFEKDQKAAEKRAAKEEKVEKQHQKALEKEEKKHQKELEKDQKEETKHQNEFEREQNEREERERLEAAEAERRRHEKEAAGVAAVGTGAAGTAAYAAHEKETTPKTSQDTDRNRLHKDPPQKKPGILKRIFKRRANKDTGVDEDYSTDEEDEPHHDTHLAGAGAVGGAGGAAGTAAAAHESHKPTDAGTDYEGGQGTRFLKPSYNPLHKDDFAPGTAETPIADNLAQERQGYHPSAGTTGVNDSVTSSSRYPAGENTSAIPYEPKKDPEAGKHLDELEQQQQHHQPERQGGLAHRFIDQLKPLPDPNKAAEQHGQEYQRY
ncbi:hypothetical protein A1O1_07058 [Capronia coronata CBS 617.96]|uniref:Uncharacterized protein n=1 Tax=Capronia coronata CBS 617.96 TaxID=1182541 RepID=W9Y1E4_9EURO|nr:uncharacterized protein A1O1_07058 [Capronia coronata CBS 617.96]EXJ83435.1 hypothetical protein A1O1_07058 [Capronia coronata CBS 617.96]